MTIHNGDCIEVMAGFDADSIDAIVTDPPYGLGFMGKAWDSAAAMHLPPSAEALDSPLARFRTGKGPAAVAFESKAFQSWCEAWAREAFRVAKPGAHLLAFGGTRTYHRLATAIEDAGWEIRDTLVWAYASGFPKSLDVSKAIDKANGKYDRDLASFGAYVRQAREARGWSLRQLDEAMGTNTAASWWEGRKSGVQPPSVATYARLKGVLGLDDRYDSLIAWAEAEREKVGERIGAGNGSVVGLGSPPSMASVTDITAPATDLAREWQGWGTALKPAWEPIVLARKPLRGTVAGNVTEYGTGALNIDGTRIPSEPYSYPNGAGGSRFKFDPTPNRPDAIESNPAGRWPSNLLLTDPIFDGDTPGVVGGGDTGRSQGGNSTQIDVGSGRYNWNNGSRDTTPDGIDPGYGDSGTYSRFFLIPKAARTDREPVLGGLPQQHAGIAIRQAEAGAYEDFVYPAPEGIGQWLREHREAAGLRQKDVAAYFPSRTGGMTGCVANWELELNRPTPDQWTKLRTAIGFDDRYDEVMTTTRPVPRQLMEGAPTRRANVHPTVKPTDLMRHLVRLVTPPGGVVLDPFLGSGTTAIAAELEGFEWVGIEREAEYVAIAEARLNGTQRGLGLAV
jgi:DNA modification methylase